MLKLSKNQKKTKLHCTKLHTKKKRWQGITVCWFWICWIQADWYRLQVYNRYVTLNCCHIVVLPAKNIQAQMNSLGIWNHEIYNRNVRQIQIGPQAGKEMRVWHKPFERGYWYSCRRWNIARKVLRPPSERQLLRFPWMSYSSRLTAYLQYWKKAFNLGINPNRDA